MELYKWISNHPETLKDTTISEYAFQKHSPKIFEYALEILGHFVFKFCLIILFSKLISISKISILNENVLSGIVKIYDPLDLINPIFTKTKICIQDLRE